MPTLVLPAQSDILPAPARVVAPYFLLILIIFAVYGNIYDNVYLFDDDLLITLNDHIKSWGSIGAILTGSTTSGAKIAGGFYRPFQMLLYLFAYQLGGGTTFLFHLLNITLHAANACLVYRLGIKLKFNPYSSLIAAIIWCVHPLHTEAITYMSGTADPLFAFVCLSTVVWMMPVVSPIKIWKTLPLYVIALGCKETAVMLPLLICICHFYISPERLKWRSYLSTWPLWGIALLYVLWRVTTKELDGPQTFARLYDMHSFANLKSYSDHISYRIDTCFATIAAYTRLLVWPSDLHMERSFSIYTDFFHPAVIAGFTLILICFIVVLASTYKSGRPSALSFGFLWFAAAHVPDTGILIPMNALFLEHWMYLPSAGLFLGISEALTLQIIKFKRWVGISVSVAALALGGIYASKTYAQNVIWRDPPNFYNNIFSYGENSARAHNNLALYYADHNDYLNSIEQFKEAINISDSYAETRHNLALIYLRMPDQRAHIQDAIDNLNQAIKIDPNFYRSYLTLSDLYKWLGDKDKAAAYAQKGQELKMLRQ